MFSNEVACANIPEKREQPSRKVSNSLNFMVLALRWYIKGTKCNVNENVKCCLVLGRDKNHIIKVTSSGITIIISATAQLSSVACHIPLLSDRAIRYFAKATSLKLNSRTFITTCYLSASLKYSLVICTALKQAANYEYRAGKAFAPRMETMGFLCFRQAMGNGERRLQC